MKKIAASGGPAQTLCEVPWGAWIGTWSEAGGILFASGGGPIYRVSGEGGTPAAVTELDREAGELAHNSPHFLPDGNHFFYRKWYEPGRGDAAEVHLTSLDEPRSSRVVLRNGALYAAPGYVLFTDPDLTLYAQPFDLERLELSGTRTPLAKDVLAPHGYLSVSVAANGTLVLGKARNAGGVRLVVRDRSGTVRGDVGRTGTFGLSRDGRRVALNRNGLQLVTPGRSAGPTRLGEAEDEFEPVWSPDDRHVIYGRQGESTELIYRTVDVEEERSLPLPPVDDIWPSDWSPDGETVAFSIPDVKLGGSLDIWFYSIEEEAGKPFLATAANELMGVFSPDGKRLAYQSDESGEYNVYVRPLSGSGAPVRLSPSGGSSPEWRRDGRELFYMRPDGTVMAVAVEDDSGFDEPVALFRVSPRAFEEFDLFDVSPDGETFLVLEQDGPPAPLTLFQNWTTLLER